jgi:outer membrane biosynthesis protein TonB
MWRWQLKSLRSKKLDAWSRLFLLSLSAHLVFVFVMLFIYKGNSYHIDLTFNARNLAHATIVFMPLHKKIAQPNIPSAAAQDRGIPRTSTSALRASADTQDERVGTKKIESPTQSAKQNSPTQVKKTETSIAAAKPEKTAVAKTPPATRLATTAAPVTKTKKKIQNKKDKSSGKKTTRQETKAIEIQKSVETQKKAVEKSEQKPKAEQAKVEAITPVAATAQIPTTSEQVETGITLPGATDQNIVYVGQDDLDALKLQQVIQQEIGTHFKPPAGLSKQLQCQLTLVVGFDGTVINVTVHQSSGAAIFDMSARNAVSKLTLPAWTHGKELTITFNN